ncbi:zinc finger CHY domain protein [Halovivax asiaticus JCM 14624]|uniref:Zinc finger CHY domain protein n=1 Tax=Halovivax asiaticus JCM 14624 TaxID=1227490 RepID=M0BCK1_9EURY|nr:CHY zinc finger protein [Halovivax asiaticus]ELZ08646.1 zinc finger CHY domain protein [Halovivax asiaticus JCM 14624]
MKSVHGVPVCGVDLDAETRCAHYDSDRDVVALRFGCCDSYYACHACHEAVTDHEAQVWPRSRFDEAAVLCGVCGATLTPGAYFDAANRCPACDAAFNPGCRAHRDRYFETE